MGVKLSVPVPAAAALCMRAKKDSSVITGIAPDLQDYVKSVYGVGYKFEI